MASITCELHNNAGAIGEVEYWDYTEFEEGLTCKAIGISLMIRIDDPLMDAVLEGDPNELTLLVDNDIFVPTWWRIRSDTKLFEAAFALKEC